MRREAGSAQNRREGVARACRITLVHDIAIVHAEAMALARDIGVVCRVCLSDS
jgi:predicted transcriptional regulator